MANFAKADTVRRNMLNNYNIIDSDKSPEAAAKFHTAYAQYQKALKGSKYKIGKVTEKESAQLKGLDNDIRAVQDKLLVKYPLTPQVAEAVAVTVKQVIPTKPATPVKAPVVDVVKSQAAAAARAQSAAAIEATMSAAVNEAARSAEAEEAARAAATRLAAEKAAKLAAEEAAKLAAEEAAKLAAKPPAAPQNSSFNLNLLIACAAASTATLALGIAALLLAMQTVGVVLSALGVAGAAYSAYRFFTKPAVATQDEAPKASPAQAMPT